MLDVLYEDNHLLVLNKTAMLPTMGVDSQTKSLLTVAKDYLKQRYQKPGNVYLGVVSRLDSFTSGAVVFARTSKAAARLTRQFQQRENEKFYLCATQLDSSGDAMGLGLQKGQLPWEPPFPRSWEDWIWHDEPARRMRCLGKTARQKSPREAKQAKLEWKCLGTCSGDRQVNVVHLITGRKHQIRAQFSSRGLPILGDRKYDSDSAFPNGIALHAWLLGFQHPVRNERMRFWAPLPDSWTGLGAIQMAERKVDCREYLDRAGQNWTQLV